MTQLKAKKVVEGVQEKWVGIMEERRAVDVKCAALEKKAKDEQEVATKRKADLVDQAQRRVQEETIAKAAKRGHTSVPAAVQADAETDEAIGAGSGDPSILERDVPEATTPAVMVPEVAPAPVPVPVLPVSFAQAAADLFAL